ncbi:MAG: hypothetical protein AAGI15_02060 [Pseudomonadota bacterium]
MSGKSAEQVGVTQREFSDAVEALRSSFDDEQESGWTREITALALVISLVAVLSWAYIAEQRRVVFAIQPRPVDVSALADDQAWIGMATQQALHAYLGVSERIELVEAVSSVAVDRATLLLPARQTNWLLETRFRPSAQRSGHLYLDLTLTDQRQDLTRTATLSGSVAGLSDLAARGVGQVQAWLGLRALDAVETRLADAELLTSRRARRAFAEASAALARRDARRATERLAVAEKDAPDHPLVQLALADAWSQLGYTAKATTFARSAFELRGSLSRERQLNIEGQYRMLSNDWARAESVYRALWEFFPTDLNYGLALINSQLADAKVNPAMETLEQLRRLPDPFGSDPRVDMAEALIHRRAGDWSAGRMATAKVIAKARALDADDLLANALALQWGMTSDNPDPELLTEAQSLFEVSSNMQGMIEVLQSRGVDARRRGLLEESAAAHRQALVLAQDLGNEAAVATSMNMLSITLDLQGDLEEGLRYKREVAESYLRRGVRGGHAVMQENIGHSLLKLGELAQAQRQFARAGEHFVEVSDEIGLAWRPYHQARVLLFRGELADARVAFEEAQRNAQTRPEGSLAEHSRFFLGEISFFELRLAEATAIAKAMEQVYRAAQLTPDVAIAQLLQGRIAVTEGRLEQAVGLYEATAKTLAGMDLKPYEQRLQINRIDLWLRLHTQSDLTRGRAQALEADCQLGPLLSSQRALIRLRAQIRHVLCLQRQPGAELTTARSVLEEVIKASEALGLREPEVEALDALRYLQHRSGVTDPRTTTRLAGRLQPGGWQYHGMLGESPAQTLITSRKDVAGD